MPELGAAASGPNEAAARDGVVLTCVTQAHRLDFLTEMVAAVFITILLHWQHLDDYPLREHLDEAARFLGRAIARAR